MPELRDLGYMGYLSAYKLQLECVEKQLTDEAGRSNNICIQLFRDRRQMRTVFRGYGYASQMSAN